MKFIKNTLPFFLIIFFSFWAIKSFFIEGFFPIHDDTQIARVFEMHNALSDGMFPVRWVSDLGYNFGYPIFNFYAPLAYYIGGVVNLFGFDSLVATKIMMILGIMLSGICMYIFAKEFWGKAGGLVSSLLYIYAPYHALDIYVRGDVAELYAYACIPLIFYGLWKSYKEKRWQYVIVGSLGYAAVILSHNLTALMVTPFVLVFASILFISSYQKKKQTKKAYYPLLILLIGILLSAFYWLPVFSEMHYTNILSQVGGGADYKDHYVCPMQLWDSPWGFGGSTASCIDGLSFKMGKVHGLLFVLSIAGLLIFRKKVNIPVWTILFSVCSLVAAVFLTLSGSQFIWDSIPQMAFLQYPWRFLLIICFFLSFVGGAGIVVLKNIFSSRVLQYSVVGVICVAIIYFNVEIFAPQTILHKSVDDYTSKAIISWETSKISDEYLPKGFYKPHNRNEVPSAKLTNSKNSEVISLSEKTQAIHAEVIAQKKDELKINVAYFPAWHVFVDEKEVGFTVTNRGLLITIPQGKHVIDIRFMQTPIEKFANLLSITGVFILIIGIIIAKRKEQKNVKSA